MEKGRSDTSSKNHGKTYRRLKNNDRRSKCSTFLLIGTVGLATGLKNDRDLLKKKEDHKASYHKEKEAHEMTSII